MMSRAPPTRPSYRRSSACTSRASWTLFAYYLFNDVLVTVLFFIAIVLRARFGLGIDGLLWLALLYHFIALQATFAFGHAADRWGQRATIYVMVTILGVALLSLAFATEIVAAVIVLILLGLVYGSLQAVCRSLLALLIHSRNAAEIFGFNTVAGRLTVCGAWATGLRCRPGDFGEPDGGP